MSETIEEVLIDHICDVAPDYPLERVYFMLDKYPDKDVYIECKGRTPYLLVRLSNSRYSFFGSKHDSEFHEDGSASERGWCRFMTHSYKIVRDTGVMPYAHRS